MQRFYQAGTVVINPALEWDRSSWESIWESQLLLLKKKQIGEHWLISMGQQSLQNVRHHAMVGELFPAVLRR